MIQSIQRAVAILRSFTEAEPELGVTELSRRLHLHKSTISRILSTLQAEGLVDQNPQTGNYRLGVGLVSLAGVALGRLDVRGAAQPFLNRLVEVTQETVNVTILDGRDCVNIERAASPQSIRYVGWIGRRTPLHCTASGKVLLAYMPAEQRQLLLLLPLPQYTAKTVTDLATLAQQLRQIKQNGYAVVHEEFEEGFSAVAAPVRALGGQVMATISVSGPTFRLDSDQMAQIVPPLLEVTGQVSAQLGYVAGGE
jgi:IclR family transcriptional regulator, acetate operon repressor